MGINRHISLVIFLFTCCGFYKTCSPFEPAPKLLTFAESKAYKDFLRKVKLDTLTAKQTFETANPAQKFAESKAYKDFLRKVKLDTLTAKQTFEQQKAAARGAAAAEEKGAIPAVVPVGDSTVAKKALTDLFAKAVAPAEPESKWKDEALVIINTRIEKAKKAAPNTDDFYSVPDLIVYAENLLLDQAFHDSMPQPAVSDVADDAFLAKLQTIIKELQKNNPNKDIASVVTNIATITGDETSKLWDLVKIVIQVRGTAMKLLAAEVAKAAVPPAAAEEKGQ